MMLNKVNLVRMAAKRADVSQRDTENVLNAMMDVSLEALHHHNGVRVVNFGSIKPVHRAARRGRNPQTGKPIKIAARYVPKFTAGKAVRKAVDSHVR